MTARDTILERIRQNKPEIKPLPDNFAVLDGPQSKEQLIALFRKNLKKAGAEVNKLKQEEIQVYIEEKFHDPVDLRIPEIKKKYEGAYSNSELGKTKTVILEGQFGVAENGAVWLDETNFPNRLLPFVTLQLVIVLDKNKIAGNMHQAYQWADLQGTGFGVFISGPSKTADIEQSLVYGAHGAKELFVLIY